METEEIILELRKISKLKNEIEKERKLKSLSTKSDTTLATLKKEFDKIEVEKGGTSAAIQQLNALANRGDDISSEVWYHLSIKQFDKAMELIVKFVMDKEKIFTTRDDIKEQMFIYRDGIYVPKARSYIKEICREILGRGYTDERGRHVMNKIAVDTYIDPEEFFADKNIDEVAVENGILNLDTRELSEFTPEKFLFNKLPVKYDPEAKCPAIEKFLGEVLRCEDDKKVIYELAGFGLHREYFIEKALMFVGSGRNGKGKTLELLKRFVGAENTCSVHLVAMQYNTSALCELHNRLLNLGGDLSPTSLKDLGMFKQLTGRDVVQVKRKYLNDLIFQNYAKFVFACNELPIVYDMSLGFWSRWILLDFPNKFVSKKEFDLLSEKEKVGCNIIDPDITDKITNPKELSGFLNEALDGLQRLKKQKDFSYSQGVKEVKDCWVRKSDSFMAFCMDCLEEGEGFIFKDRLRKEFLKYRKRYGISKGASDAHIAKTLQEVLGASDDRRNLGIFGDVGFVPQKYCWSGIKFKREMNE